MNRRTFLTCTGTAALGACAAPWFGLPSVTAAEAALDARAVRFAPEIEPLVRFIEDTPRERLLEEIGTKVRRGLSYREVLAALLLAGVRNIQPRPVGFKFHAVLVVNSAHLASIASPDSERWLPIFWALDQFKSSQAADVREGDWTLAPVQESALPKPHQARKALLDALDHWDEPAADAAITAMARSAPAHDIFQILCKYGARDFREIGHKEIYVANSFRTLEVIGWHHAEPVLRSLTYALLDRDGAKDNPAKSDYSADRPYRQNVEAVSRLRGDWLEGKPDPAATDEMLLTLRGGSAQEASEKAIQLINRGAAPASLFDAYFEAAGELMMRAPGILALHASTFTNALHYSWQHCADEQTRKLLLLQNASFLPLFRGRPVNGPIEIDQLEPAEVDKSKDKAVEEIFATMSSDRPAAARKVLGFMRAHNDARSFADAARRLIFLKGTNSHDYKYSSAVLEDYSAMASPWRDRYLAASAYYLKGSAEPDNRLVERIRGSLT